MTTPLHDRLAELADDAPTGGPVPDLWDRGRRVHRLRRAGTLVIVAVAALLLTGTAFLVHVRSAPQLLPASGTAGVPDRLFVPSRWLPGTDEKGPLGQLAAAGSARRGGWFGSSDAVVGVSAVTGEYRFLDLPDLADAWGGWSLAPDGRHVAYWTTGEPSGSPNTFSGQSDPVTGVAVYDTSTGDVVRQEFETEHGLEVDELAWSDAQTLVLRYGQIAVGDDGPEDQQGLSLDYVWLRWAVGEAEPVPLRAGGQGSWLWFAGGGWMASNDGGPRSLRLVDANDPARTRQVRLDRGFTTEPVPNATGDRLAGVPGDRTPHPLGVVEVDDVGRGRTTTVPEAAWTHEVLSWVDPDRVAVLREHRRNATTMVVSVVDVTDGSVTDLVRLPPTGWGPAIATDLLATPTRPAVRPPTPLGPWPPVVLTGAVLLSAGCATLLWRRRVRP